MQLKRSVFWWGLAVITSVILGVFLMVLVGDPTTKNAHDLVESDSGDEKTTRSTERTDLSNRHQVVGTVETIATVDEESHTGTPIDPAWACSKINWYKVTDWESIPSECERALDHHYMDVEAGTYPFFRSFGTPVSFRTVYADLDRSRERVIDALEREECWVTNGDLSPAIDPKSCHAKAFLQYGIALHLCIELNLSRVDDWLKENWIRLNCHRHKELLDAPRLSEQLAKTPFTSILHELFQFEYDFEDDSVGDALLLLAVSLGDETAVGLSMLQNGLLAKNHHVWRRNFSFAALAKHDAEWVKIWGLPEFDIKRTMSMALEIALGIQAVGVEPNWQNLVEEALTWTTTDEGSIQEAVLELGSDLDPLDDIEELRALDRFEQVALKLGVYDQ